MATTATLAAPVPPAVLRAHDRRRDAILVVAWAGLVAVLALWVSRGGLQQTAGDASAALTSSGRLLGLLASYLLLVQVALMARVPWVERAWGQDGLARAHRLVGFTSFSLMLGHILLVVTGYAAGSGSPVLAQAWDMVLTFPGMLLALAGTASLVMVSVTSVRIARRRLRYASWHLLHLYAYLGVGLALPHQLWTGTDFIASGWARAFWWTAYGAVAVAVVTYRVLLPLRRSWRHRLVVEQVVQEAPGVVSLHVRGRRLDRMPVAAGQFFLWRFLGRPGWTRAHPYSLSAAPRGDRLRVTVKSLGPDSADLALVRPGTRVLVEGPYGRLTPERRSRGGVLMVACGIGVTPIRALLEEMDYAPGQAVLLYRTAGSSGVLFADELDRLAAHRGVRVVHLPGHRLSGRRTWLPESAAHLDDVSALLHLVPDVARRDVFVCGPEPWMDAVVAAARGAGVPRDALHLERFAY